MKTRDDRNIEAEASRRQAAPAFETQRASGRGFAGARAIASLVPGITRKSFEKHGFAAASLIMDWARIVGTDRASLTRPLKLKWPRGIEKSAETGEQDKGRPGATLWLQVDPAIALDLQYQSAQLIERINAYFGYRAVAAIKLVQEEIETPHQDVRQQPTGPHTGRSIPALRPATPDAATPSVEAETGDDPLAAALARLGAHVSARTGRT